MDTPVLQYWKRDALRALAAAAALLGTTACGVAPDSAAALRPTVVSHAAWEVGPPLGHEADAVRRNLATGDTLRLHDYRLSLVAVEADTTAGADRAVVELQQGEDTARRIVAEGAAFNWEGLHVAVLAVRTGEGELGAGLSEFEVATVASLPPEVAERTTAGGAADRLRIPHRIRWITLHHSGSPEPLRPEDDPVEKLRGLQTWGQRERNWWDVPYHFLVDLDGTIYQGRDWRYMGETNTGYDPRGHLLISVLGNYNQQEPTEAQIEAITELMAWASVKFNVPPERIGGHRDYADTSCPGSGLARYLDDGTFVEGVEARIAEVSE